MDKIQITAETVEEFNEIKKAFELLPKSVRDGIFSASKKFDNIRYDLKPSFGDNKKIKVVGDISNLHVSNKGSVIYTKYGIFQYSKVIENGIDIDVIDYKLS